MLLPTRTTSKSSVGLGKPELMMTPRPYSFHLDSSTSDAASRPRHESGSLRWQDPSSASYHPNSASNSDQASKRNSTQSFHLSSSSRRESVPLPRSSVRALPRTMSPLDCTVGSSQSVSAPLSPSPSDSSQSRIPVFVQRKPTNHSNKNFYVVGRKTPSTPAPLPGPPHPNSHYTEPAPPISPRVDTPSSPSIPSPGTISAKAFRRSVASSTHCGVVGIMQLDAANASTSNLSFQSNETASVLGGVLDPGVGQGTPSQSTSGSLRPRSKSQASSQIPQGMGKSRRAASETVVPAVRLDSRCDSEATELPYHHHQPTTTTTTATTSTNDSLLSVAGQVGVYQQQQKQQKQQHQQERPWLTHEPSVSDFGETSSFFREIMDSRADSDNNNTTTTDLVDHKIPVRPLVSSSPDPLLRRPAPREPVIPILQAMASETQRILDERYGVLVQEGGAHPHPPPPMVLAPRATASTPPPLLARVEGGSRGEGEGEGERGGGGGGSVTRANTQKSGVLGSGTRKRVPPPAVPEGLLVSAPAPAPSSASTAASASPSASASASASSVPIPTPQFQVPTPQMQMQMHERLQVATGTVPHAHAHAHAHAQVQVQASHPSSLLSPHPQTHPPRADRLGEEVLLPQSSNYVRISRRTPRPLSAVGGGQALVGKSGVQKGGNRIPKAKPKPEQPSSIFGRLLFGIGVGKPKAKAQFKASKATATPATRMDARTVVVPSGNSRTSQLDFGRGCGAGRAASWVTGTFVIDPALRVPGGIFLGSGSAMVSQAAVREKESSKGGDVGEDSSKRKGNGREGKKDRVRERNEKKKEKKKKNLEVEVQNGGVDVCVRVVIPTAAPAVPPSLDGAEAGRGPPTEMEFRLLGGEGGGKSVGEGVDAEGEGGCKEEEEVFPIIARIDAPRPRAPLHLFASTVGLAYPPRTRTGRNNNNNSNTRSKSVDVGVREKGREKDRDRDYVLVDTPLSSESLHTPQARGVKGDRGSSAGTPATPTPTGTLRDAATRNSNAPRESQRLSRSSTGKRLSKASSATTARPYHLPSSLVSAEEADGGEGALHLPFPTTASPTLGGEVEYPSASASAIRSNLGTPGPVLLNPRRPWEEDSDRQQLQCNATSASPVYLALPRTFRGPLSVVVLSLGGAGGVAEHVEMSEGVRRVAVLLEETSGEGEGRGVWFVGGLGGGGGGGGGVDIAEGSGQEDDGRGGDGESGSGSESESEGEREKGMEKGKGRVMSGVWLAGGHTDSMSAGRVRRSATAPSTPTRCDNPTPGSSRHYTRPGARKARDAGLQCVDTPTPAPPFGFGFGGTARDCGGGGGGGGSSESDSTYDCGATTAGGGRGCTSPEEVWSGDRVEVVVGRGRVVLRFWGEEEGSTAGDEYRQG